MNRSTDIAEARIIPRAEHTLSRKAVSSNALKVLYRLHQSGYGAYIVGGGVRDLLLGRHPKDFDVATDAHPEEVRQLFRNCRLIGRRFRLAHVHFGDEIIEVATFRGSSQDSKSDDAVLRNGMIIRDNVYATLEEDVWRRDFTVNALYYNIADFSVIDFTNGWDDLKNRQLRLIGDPKIRYQEDPVRMLRAVRFAAKLDFNIEAKTRAPISTMASLLQQVSSSRLFEEFLKLFLTGHSLQSFQLLRQYGLLIYLFPSLTDLLNKKDSIFPVEQFVQRVLTNTDHRIKEEKTVTPSFLFATLLWYPLREIANALEAQGLSRYSALEAAGNTLLHQQIKHVAMTKRAGVGTREIWVMQLRLEHAFRNEYAFRLLSHPRFRAGFDFLLLRSEAGESIQEIAHWWKAFHDGDAAAKQALISPDARKPRRRKRSRSKSKKMNNPPEPDV